jgi:ABC-type multidrug transport system fused ATPase/permease subunit
MGMLGGGGPRGLIEGYHDETGKAFDLHVVRRLGAYLAPHGGRMALATLLTLIMTGAGLLSPYLIKVAIDTYIGGRDYQGLVRVALLTAAVYIISYVTTSQQQYILSWVGQRILNTMRVQLFTHFQRLSLTFHSRNIVGVLLSRVVNDVGVINELISTGFISLFGDIVFLAGTVIVMLSMSWKLALLAFSVMPLMALATWIFSRAARGAYRETREKIGAMTGDLAENLSSMRVVQAFAQEDMTSRHFDDLNAANRDVNIRAMTLSFIFLPTAEILGTLATVIVLWAGGIWVAGGAVTLGIVVAFTNYVARFFQPIRDLSQIYTTFQAAMAGGERIFALLDEPLDITDAPEAKVLSAVQGSIEFRDVSFEYEPGVPVLQDVSLEVQPGQTIALVGPTGAGKTTIASLVARFYDPTRGQVLVDGHDIRSVTQDSLHAQLGIVPQEPFLFQTTVAENIRFSRPQASDDDVRSAAKLANADEFIANLSEGYQTPIMEAGVNLSQGQRQLLCFARAILADPHILILDEATSSVDTRTELLIQDALRRLLKGRTSLVIAHRLSTIREADLICVIDGGRIVEKGKHEELLALGGLYSNLYAQQFRAESEAVST